MEEGDKVMKEKLSSKIVSKKAKVGIIGLGYVGLPLVLRFVDERFVVTGFDTDGSKVERLNAGSSYIDHIPSDKIKESVEKKLFTATTNFKKLHLMDVIIICVPTPLDEKREPCLKYVEDTTEEITRHLKKGQLISLESTTYPGTTEEILLPKLCSKGYKAGKDFFLVFSPEREDPGNKSYSVKNIPKIVGGTTKTCAEMGRLIYEQIVDRVMVVSSTGTAEMTKLLENIYRSVNIALVNELKMLCDRMGLDIWEVIDAASTKPFGFTPFYPGPGLGGHCIPIDPFYLSWKAKEYDFATRFIELAGEINTSTPYYVVSKLTAAFNEMEKSIKGSKVLVLGVAYKKDVDDQRESPAIKIIEILMNKGAEVFYNDPYVPEFAGLRHYNFSMSSTELTDELLKDIDAAMIITDHSVYNYDWIVEHSRLVIDTRNATKNVIKGRERIVKA
ncbi:MAG: nucleotide sugar dehydrogenase [Thermodesulfobacteriota bacterium]